VQLNHLNGPSPTFPSWAYGPPIRLVCTGALLLLILLPLLGFPARAQTSRKRNVLILSEVGLSHSLTTLIMEQIVSGVEEMPNRHVELYSESLDLSSFPLKPSSDETRAWIDKKYGSYKLEVVVAVGPGAIDFLSRYTQSLFLDVPIVICGASPAQLSNPKLDSRFTGTWMELEPRKTLELALRLFPDTRHVFVVGGSSSFDKVAISLTKSAVTSVASKAEIRYLTDMEMGKLLQQLRELPSHSVELYTSFFEDSTGNKFLNSTRALPAIAAASNAPDFGMSDTYIGHGIVGGYVMPFENKERLPLRSCQSYSMEKNHRKFRFRPSLVSTCSTGANCKLGTSPKVSSPREVSSCFANPAFGSVTNGHGALYWRLSLVSPLWWPTSSTAESNSRLPVIGKCSSAVC
jgi:hypothetical protein